MGQPDVRNLPALNKMPSYGHLLVQALKDIRGLVRNVAQQTNAMPQGESTPPPQQIHALHVTAGGGIAHVQITDENPVYRGISYHVQYSSDVGFSAPITVYMGPSRDIRIPVGTEPLHYRAFSDYPTSAPSDPVYHGGSQPIPIAAIGTAQPPIPSGQGSGTGYPSQISGHGPIPYRGELPPRRA